MTAPAYHTNLPTPSLVTARARSLIERRRPIMASYVSFAFVNIMKICLSRLGYGGGTKKLHSHIQPTSGSLGRVNRRAEITMLDLGRLELLFNGGGPRFPALAIKV